MTRNIVFDLGNVLIAWDIHAAFRHAFDSDDAIDRFLREVSFDAWNLEQDRGRSRADAVAAIRATHPQYADLMDGYFDRFGATIQNKITGSWEIMEQLRARGYRIFAITNWSAVTWPIALDLHPQLAGAFEEIIVSGQEGLIKPDPAIFDLFIDRTGVLPGECLFIDDSPRNVKAARALGWQAHQFQTPEILRSSLLEAGLL